jgi:geranylgeranyl diphosphate synthase, type II
VSADPRPATRTRAPSAFAGDERSEGDGAGEPGPAAVEVAGFPIDLGDEVERYLERLVFDGDAATSGLQDAMRYSLLAGGKRIRPVLALATAEAVGRPVREVLPLAAALELVHTYSLIHDDLPAMDDDELRRGRPTCHVAYGEGVAILAGDGLFAEGLKLLLEQQGGAPERVLTAARELVAAAGVAGMVGGQYLDVTGAAVADGDSLRRLHALKTGRLIGASVECVLLLAGLKAEETAPYRDFARELGVLFQIVDDILDVAGDEEATGKPRGSDERHGKATYVSVFGVERARALAQESHARARAALASADGETAKLGQVADYILTRTR